MADAYVGLSGANAFVGGNRGNGLQSFAIASSCGTCSLPHQDANGCSTIVTVREGLKLWVWGVRQSPLPAPLPESTPLLVESNASHVTLEAAREPCNRGEAFQQVPAASTSTAQSARSRSWQWSLFVDCLVYCAILGPGDSM